MTLPLHVGGGAIIGAVLGYLTKLMLRAMIVISVGFVCVLWFLEAKGIVHTVHWDQLFGLFPSIETFGLHNITNAVVAFVPATGSFIMGFTIGFYMG